MFKVEKKQAFDISNIKDLTKIFDQIDYDPPYQRYGNVWNLEKKQLLIDTIINQYDIPKIYLHFITEFNSEINKSGKSYAIIDGKQRLKTIEEFIKGEFKLSDDFVFENYTNLNLSGLSYLDLSKFFPEVKYDFDRFNLDIVYIITNDIEKIEEFFYRLNEGKPLNNAEKRNRFVGYINQKIKAIIATHPFFQHRFKSPNSRLQYEDLCLKLIYTEFNEKLVSFDKKALDTFVENNREQTKELSDAIDRTNTNLNTLCDIFVDNDPLLKQRSIIPVYYYFISREITKYDIIRDFLVKFEEVKVINRKQKDGNPILLEFDRQNQQGVHRAKSLISRFEILSKYYLKFLEGNLNWNTRVPLDDMIIKIEDE